MEEPITRHQDNMDSEDILPPVPAVVMCAVMGVPDERWGEAVKAVVVRKPGADVTVSVAFVDTLPLTAVGKADKKALRVQYWGGQEPFVR
jgi:fatty-acyl-CoA synthase